jgi:N-acetylglucosamine-6-phosphate deacetylase
MGPLRIRARRALLERGLAHDVTISVDGGRVSSVDEGGAREGTTLEAELVAPGLVDLQFNGGFGIEIGERAEDIVEVAQRLPATGVTAFLPTLVTLPEDAYPPALAAFADARRALKGAGPHAVPLGLHLEGPFLSPDASGAHSRADIERADDALFDRLVASGVVSLMTLAPERDGALARIRRLVLAGIVVSVGHTRATYEEAILAFDAGATVVTHLFNAMSPLAHRAPGMVGAALVDDRVVCGVIVDGVHAHDAAIRLALRAKSAARIVLVTDAMAAAGLGPGTYSLAGRRVVVDATSARLEDGTLAGSILTLDAAVRNAVALGVPLADALRMASEVPARVLGLTAKGKIAAGADADLVLFDDDVRVQATMVGGEIAWRDQRASG